MKKLMVAFAISCFAVASYGAQIVWGSTIDLVDKDTGASLESTPYKFVLAYMPTPGDISTAQVRDTGTFSWTGEYNEITGAYTLTASDVDGYVYTILAKDADGKLYSLNEYDTGNPIASYTLSGYGGDPTSTTVPSFDFGNAEGSGFYVNAQAIPEPTSGLLLLLGVAGLALRRRRA